MGKFAREMVMVKWAVVLLFLLGLHAAVGKWCESYDNCAKCCNAVEKKAKSLFQSEEKDRYSKAFRSLWSWVPDDFLTSLEQGEVAEFKEAVDEQAPLPVKRKKLFKLLPKVRNFCTAISGYKKAKDAEEEPTPQPWCIFSQAENYFENAFDPGYKMATIYKQVCSFQACCPSSWMNYLHYTLLLKADSGFWKKLDEYSPSLTLSGGVNNAGVVIATPTSSDSDSTSVCIKFSETVKSAELEYAIAKRLTDFSNLQSLPYFCRFIESSATGSVSFMVMEAAKGTLDKYLSTTLRKVFSENPVLADVWAQSMILQLGFALSVSQREIYFRWSDWKGDNLLLRPLPKSLQKDWIFKFDPTDSEEEAQYFLLPFDTSVAPFQWDGVPVQPIFADFGSVSALFGDTLVYGDALFDKALLGTEDDPVSAEEYRERYTKLETPKVDTQGLVELIHQVVNDVEDLKFNAAVSSWKDFVSASDLLQTSFVQKLRFDPPKNFDWSTVVAVGFKL